MSSFDTKTQDTILALQLTVGGAGERAEDPQRLGWWNTDLTDEMAGGDPFALLRPKTAAWARLEMARQCCGLTAPPEVAKLLKVTDKTVHSLAQKGTLPGFKVGGQWRFKRVDIDAWIEEQKAAAQGREGAKE